MQVLGLEDKAAAERVHISFFGRRNAGKSSIVNAVTGQEMSIVSDVAGTTTDPVRKTMEILPLGPVVIIDTPGLDDEGTLGEKRVEKMREALARTDIAVIVLDGDSASEDLKALSEELFKRGIPYIVLLNKCDLISDIRSPEDFPESIKSVFPKAEKFQCASARTGQGIEELKNSLAVHTLKAKKEKPIVSDLLKAGDMIILVIPIDESAPKGRIILPQQSVLREALDSHCAVTCCQPEELGGVLDKLSISPRLVVTDSQAISEVAAIVPPDIALTTFSILFARYKGNLETLSEGAKRLMELKEGGRVLLSEGCTHHRQCNDIGTVKLPGLIQKHLGISLNFSFSSGMGFPADAELSGYDLIIHCGGCMLNEKEMQDRMRRAKEAGVPMVNYGMVFAVLNGTLKRCLAPFGK